MFYKATFVTKYRFYLHVIHNTNNYFTYYRLLMVINKWDIEI